MIRLSKPYIPESAIRNVVKVLESGNLVQGEYVLSFEKELGQYLHARHTILVSSGTAALHLALMGLKIKSGDEVIVPAFTYPATANVVEIVGAKPVLVDISADDFCIDTSLIEKAITSKTKAIIPVHEFGQSASMENIIFLAKKYKLLLIEDAACALGTEYKSQKVGTSGHLGCFSFHPRKAITTGEGGAITTNDDSLAEKIRSLRNHGIRSKENHNPDFTDAGLNYRMTDFQAALGLAQLTLIDTLINHRIKIASIYNSLLSGNNKIKIPVVFHDRLMVYQSYHILLDATINRDSVISKLKEKEIETNYGAQALNCITFYKKKYNLKPGDFPVATHAFNSGLALPMGQHITEKDAAFVSEQLLSLLK